MNIQETVNLLRTRLFPPRHQSLHILCSVSLTDRKLPSNIQVLRQVPVLSGQPDLPQNRRCYCPRSGNCLREPESTAQALNS